MLGTHHIYDKSLVSLFPDEEKACRYLGTVSLSQMIQDMKCSLNTEDESFYTLCLIIKIGSFEQEYLPDYMLERLFRLFSSLIRRYWGDRVFSRHGGREFRINHTHTHAWYKSAAKRLAERPAISRRSA